MRVTPKTEKEIEEMNVWPKGTYDFEIVESTEAVSKKTGNDMIRLKLRVFNAEGGYKFVDDYLLDAIPHKLRHLSDLCGILDKYEAGGVSAIDLVGKTGSLKMVIQKGNPKEDGSGEKYPDKNSVQDYVVQKSGESAPIPAPVNRDRELDDTVPF